MKNTVIVLLSLCVSFTGYGQLQGRIFNTNRVEATDTFKLRGTAVSSISADAALGAAAASDKALPTQKAVRNYVETKFATLAPFDISNTGNVGWSVGYMPDGNNLWLKKLYFVGAVSDTTSNPGAITVTIPASTGGSGTGGAPLLNPTFSTNTDETAVTIDATAAFNTGNGLKLIMPISTSTSNGRGISIYNGTNAFATWRTWSDGTIGWGGGANAGDLFLQRTGGSQARLSSNRGTGAASLTINGGLSVGTGTTPAANSLAVGGDVTVAGTLTVGGTPITGSGGGSSINDFYDPWVHQARKMGSKIRGQTMGLTPAVVSGTITLTSGQFRMLAIPIDTITTINAIQFKLTTNGNFAVAGAGENRVALYQFDGTNFVRLGQSNDDSTLFKVANSALMVSASLQTPVSVTPGIYYAAVLWNAGFITQAPIVLGGTTNSGINANVQNWSFVGHRFSVAVSGQTAMPATLTQAQATIFNTPLYLTVTNP